MEGNIGKCGIVNKLTNREKFFEVGLIPDGVLLLRAKAPTKSLLINKVRHTCHSFFCKILGIKQARL